MSTDLGKILHTLLYGIHLWADLDRDRRVGGSRPNQNDDVFFVNAPESIQRPRIAAISAANCQSVGEDGCYREKFQNFVSWADRARSKNRIFRVFRVHLDCPARSLHETVLSQTNGTDGKPRRWSVCLLLVWRVCDQAFGRYRPLNVPKSNHVTITKIETFHTDTRRKSHLTLVVNTCFLLSSF